MRKASPFVVRLAGRLVRELAKGPKSTRELAKLTGSSAASVYRALTWLREKADAPISIIWVNKCRMWTIAEGYEIPGEVVGHDDLLRAWAKVKQLERLLEDEDVVGVVERIVIAELERLKFLRRVA